MECGVDAADLSRPAFPQHQQSGDCYSTLTDRPDERLNVRFGSDSEVSAFSHGVRLAVINGHALIEMPRQFCAGNERKWHEDDPEKCSDDHVRQLMIELLIYNQLRPTFAYPRAAERSREPS